MILIGYGVNSIGYVSLCKHKPVCICIYISIYKCECQSVKPQEQLSG